MQALNLAEILTRISGNLVISVLVQPCKGNAV